MHPFRTSVALISYSSTGDVVGTNGTGYFVSGGGLDLGPVVFVAVLWSRVGSVQPLGTDPGQKTHWDEQQIVRIVCDLDLHMLVCRLTGLPRVGRDLCCRSHLR